MKIISSIKEMKKEINSLKRKRKTIGFVPTMGYLHEGHLSLIRECVKKVHFSVVSIFVNPTQFGPGEDFEDYPRDFKRDSDILQKEGVDYIFHPSAEDMYPSDYKTYVQITELENKLCGRSRPGHFRGVSTVVLKLFNIINPDIAFFGQKDFQQSVIIKRMVRDLNLEVRIEVLPIVREKDGLAVSSRNTYLTPEQKKAALCLYSSLKVAQKMVEEGEKDTEKIIKKVEDIINQESYAKIDYVEIVNTQNLNPISRLEDEALMALAVYIGKVRLIDNTIIGLKR